MKKINICFYCIISLICILLFSACDFFGSEQPKNQVRGTVGDTLINSDNVSICLVDSINTKMLGTEYLNDTTENNFILHTIKVTNNSEKQQTFYASCVDLYNSKGIKYEATTSLYIDFIISEDIGVGITKSFQVVFETPTTTKQENYTAKIGYSRYTSDKNRVIFDLA